MCFTSPKKQEIVKWKIQILYLLFQCKLTFPVESDGPFVTTVHAKLFAEGSFNNHVDIIWTVFDPLIPTSSWTFFTLNVDKNGHFMDHLPHHVHVVFERPLTDRNIHRSFQKKYRVYIIASEARSLTQNLHWKLGQ